MPGDDVVFTLSLGLQMLSTESLARVPLYAIHGLFCCLLVCLFVHGLTRSVMGVDDNEGGAQNSGAADGSDTSSVCVDIVGDPPLPGNHSKLHSLSTFCRSSNHHCHWTFNAETQAFHCILPWTFVPPGQLQCTRPSSVLA